MEKSFPFNAVITDGVPDRVYTAEDFAAERAAYVSNGVTAGDALTVSPSALGGVRVDIAPGTAVIDGYTYFNTDALTLSLNPAHSTYARMDLIVLRLDLEARRMYCAVHTGTAAANPLLPDVQSGASVREIPLASVTVFAGDGAVESAQITDLRPRANYILNPVEVRDLLASYEAALQAYFSEEDMAALKRAGHTVRTDAGAGAVLCGDGVYRDTSLQSARAELIRFTADGTFDPAQYPTADGRYDIVLQGGGGSGGLGTHGEFTRTFGGTAGGFLALSGIPLCPGMTYLVTVGAGGEAVSSTGASPIDGKAGGDTAFGGYRAPGGSGGAGSGGSTYTPPVPPTTAGYTPNMGTENAGGAGGDSLRAPGGKNNAAGKGEDGSLGSGGGAGSRGYASDRGGDGVVIVYGLRGGV